MDCAPPRNPARNGTLCRSAGRQPAILTFCGRAERRVKDYRDRIGLQVEADSLHLHAKTPAGSGRYGGFGNRRECSSMLDFRLSGGFILDITTSKTSDCVSAPRVVEPDSSRRPAFRGCCRATRFVRSSSCSLSWTRCGPTISKSMTPNFAMDSSRLMKQGAWFTHAAYPYAKTVTCAGHATVSTGDFPSTHGMINNTWWDRDAGKMVTCTGDPQTPC